MTIGDSFHQIQKPSGQIYSSSCDGQPSSSPGFVPHSRNPPAQRDVSSAGIPAIARENQMHTVHEHSSQVLHNQFQQRPTSTTVTPISPNFSTSFQSSSSSTRHSNNYAVYAGGLPEDEATEFERGYLGGYIRVPDDWERPPADIFDHTPVFYPPTSDNPQTDPNGDHKRSESLSDRSKQLLINFFLLYPEFHFYWRPSSEVFAAFTRFIAWKVYNETGRCEFNLTVPDSVRTICRNMIRNYKARNSPFETESSESSTGLDNTEWADFEGSMDDILQLEEEYKLFKTCSPQELKDIQRETESDYQHVVESARTTSRGIMRAESVILRRALKNKNKIASDTAANPEKVKLKPNSSRRRVSKKKMIGEARYLAQETQSSTIPEFHRRFTNFEKDMNKRFESMEQTLTFLALKIGAVAERLETSSHSGVAISSSENSVTSHQKNLSTSPITTRDSDQEKSNSIGPGKEDTDSHENESDSNH